MKQRQDLPTGPLTRITDFANAGFECHPVERERWEVGDYVVGDATVIRGGFSHLELPTGRLVQAANGATWCWVP